MWPIKGQPGPGSPGTQVSQRSGAAPGGPAKLSAQFLMGVELDDGEDCL